MGFPRDQAIAALNAAFGNADRAVEYLFNGIPEEEQEQEAAPPPPQPPAGGGGPFTADSVLQAAGGAPAPAQPPAGGGGPFTADSIAAALGAAVNRPPVPQTPIQRMLAEPQLVQLITMARQNPALVQPLLEELSRSNPPLLQLVQQHQSDFMTLLNGTQPLEAAPAQPPPQAPNPAAGQPPPGAVQIQVTPEEKEAIERLQALGFPREQVLQAFLACEKNENLAANMLFDGFD